MFDMDESMFYNMDQMDFTVSVWSPDAIGMTDYI
jgi:hypothetical protein